MYAPPGFQLSIPLSTDSLPLPGPPKYLKHQVYDKPDVFAKVDEHAIQVAGCDHSSFKYLMWDLVYRFKLDDIERARVIFRWMSSKDMQTIQFESVPPGSPEETLLSFKYNRGTFARIFEIMCSYSGIHCVTVSGYAKGVDYLPGDRFAGLPSNHSWNIVYIRGSWQLVDAHWAARYLSSGRNVPENVVYEYDDFYFLMEPQQAVYSHFPEKPLWQLLPVPLTLNQFENLPLTKSQFFKCAIDFLEQHHGVVHTREGHLRMKLGFWRPGGFTYKLQYLTTSVGHPHPEELSASTADLSDRIPRLDVDLKSYLLQETTRDRLNFYFRLPASGIYYLTIYAQELSSLSIGRESTFRAACEYKIVCDTPAPDAQPYPTCHDANWGPAWPHVRHYALEPSYSDGVISVQSQQQQQSDWSAAASDVSSNTSNQPATVDIRFDKNRPEVNLLCKLHRNGMLDDLLDQYQHVTETVRETVFHVSLPEPGEYGLEIYANEPADGDTYTHMCQYLIHYESPPGWQASPHTPRMTASGADAGPSPGSLQSTRRQVTGPGVRISSGTTGALRDMFNYEQHAPSLGHLPRPYAQSQYAEAGAFDRLGETRSNHLPVHSNGHTNGGQNGTHLVSKDARILNDPARLPGTGSMNNNIYSPHPMTKNVDPVSGITGSMGGLHVRSVTSNIGYVETSSNTTTTAVFEHDPSTMATTGSQVFTRQPYMARVAMGEAPTLTRRTSGSQSPLAMRRGSLDIPNISPSWRHHRGSLPSFIRSDSWSPAEQRRNSLFANENTNANTNASGLGTQPSVVTSTQSHSIHPSPLSVNPALVNTSISDRGTQPYGYTSSSGPFGPAARTPAYNGAGQAYGHISPPGSTISSISQPSGAPNTNFSRYQRQQELQQYDQFSSTNATNLHAVGPVASGNGYRPDQSTANWGAGPIQREPPKEFALQPLATEFSVEKPRPQELPLIGEKSGLPFGSFDMFRRVDEHAVSVSQQQQDNFNQLIWQLLYARNITDELEKVRVIFLWLCTKDLHKMNFDNVKPDSPEEILMGIRTGKSTYAQIFYTLCRYAGLHCKLLIGYAKGAEYTPGMQFSGRQGQHSWNAVLVDKVWRLVDCHWAARRLIGKRPSPENVRYGLDMFYFLANPGQLIYTHFPHDPDWQLLRHPISLREFENLAPVKSAFFKYNLDLVTHRNAVILCPEPELCVSIAIPPQAEQWLSFTFGLSFDNREGSEEYRGVPLSRYGRQETQVREHKSVFYIRPPRPGAYKLLIYAKHQKEQNDSTASALDCGVSSCGSDASATGVGMYGAVCEYRVVATFGPNCSLPPYPPCQSSSYGANELAKTYPIQALRQECSLRAVRGCLEVRFNLNPPPGQPLPRLMGKLRCTLVPEEALQRSLLQRSVNANREAVFAVFLPEAGEYGLEIYANNPSKDVNSFYVIWQYIIISDSESPVRGLPTIPPAYLGQLPRFDSMHLTTVSHPDPFVQANTGELCIQLNQLREQPVRIMAQLIHASHDVSQDCSDQVLQQMRDNQVYFVIRFPHLGYFKFQIYALPYSEPGESLPSVFNYLLEATQVHRSRSGQVMSFPQQFAQWKEGCYLHAPLDGLLSPALAQGGDIIPFRVTVPKASAVAVVVGEEWTQLTKLADRWEGQVSLKPHWGRDKQLAVCANYQTSVDGNYGTLLEYQLAGVR